MPFVFGFGSSLASLQEVQAIEVKSREALPYILYTRATGEFTTLGILAFIVWICWRSELLRVSLDIALPQTAVQYLHSVENTHMHLFLTFLLYFLIMTMSLVIAQNIMKQWAASLEVYDRERRCFVSTRGKAGEASFNESQWSKDFLVIRQTFLDHLPKDFFDQKILGSTAFMQLDAEDVWHQSCCSGLFRLRVGDVLKKHNIKLDDPDSLPEFLTPWFPFSHYVLENYRDMLDYMVEIHMLSLACLAIAQGFQAGIHRMKLDFEFSYVWIIGFTLIAIGLYWYTRKFHCELKEGKYLHGELPDAGWLQSSSFCQNLCVVLQVCLLVICFELTRPMAHPWPWSINLWQSVSHVITAAVVMPLAGLGLGHLLSRLAVALSCGTVSRTNVLRIVLILEQHLHGRSYLSCRKDLDLQQIPSLEAKAKGTRSTCDTLEVKAERVPETLQRLRLDLAKCEVGPEGLRGLRLPPRISSLQLDLTMTALGLDSLKAFLLTLPKSLQVLEMNLTGCKVPVAQISNLEQVARQRLSNLTSWHLSVSFLA
eukprot:g1512.t1